MVVCRILTIALLIAQARGASVKDVLIGASSVLSPDLVAVVRVPRGTVDAAAVAEELASRAAQNRGNADDESSPEKVRTARQSKYFASNIYNKDGDRTDRSLKPEENAEDGSKGGGGGAALGKRCTTCDNGYLRGGGGGSGGGSYDRLGYRDRYNRFNSDPYASYRGRYDPYDRTTDRYYERYDDYDRDAYRGRNRYSSASAYDPYDPRERYYERGLGYDNRGYGLRERDYYSPYSRDRYEGYGPYDDYYSRGSGYDSYSSRSGYNSRPDYYGTGGYARGYNYGDRDRSGAYGYGGTYQGGSRSRYPAHDYDSGYRYTSYLYERSSSTTTDNPKGHENEQSHTMSPPPEGNSSGRSK